MKLLGFKDHIIYENDNYLVINKPAGMSALSDRQDVINVLSWLRDYWPEGQLCHRLDKETSGVLALAKNAEAYRHLSLQFQKREVIKTYHAISHGRHQFTNQEVDLDLTVGRRGIVHVVNHRGKNSQTIFNTVRVYKTNTLISCMPITGRTHQIRVHLSHLGAPIIGDVNYGGRAFYLSEIKHKYKLKKDTEERPLMSRVALHAFRLKFNLLDGEDLEFEAAYPKDFQVLLKQLEKNKIVGSL